MQNFEIKTDKNSYSSSADPNITTLGDLLKTVGVDGNAVQFSIFKGRKEIYKKSNFRFNPSDLEKKLSELDSAPIFRPKMTRMFFPTSGKSGFGFFEGNQNLKGKKFEREVLAKMYHRENQLRLSESVQEEMDKCQMNDDDTYAELLDNLQRTVLKGKKNYKKKKKYFELK